MLLASVVSFLLIGFFLGYGVRASISHRRRTQARRRYYAGAFDH